MISASKINASQFTTPGNVTDDDGLRVGTRLKCFMGVDGDLTTDVASYSYDAGSGSTTVTVISSALTENLEGFLRGPVFNDRNVPESNLCRHWHADDDDGGAMAAAGFTDASVVSRLVALAGTSPYLAGFLLGMSSTGGGFAKYQLNGTTNQITVTMANTSITLSLPQDIGVGSTPEFGNITLSELTGILVGNGSNACTALAATAGNQVPRRNSEDTAWEMVGLLLSNLGDAAFSTLYSGQALVVGDDGKWKNGDPARAGEVTGASPAAIQNIYARVSLMV